MVPSWLAFVMHAFTFNYFLVIQLFLFKQNEWLIVYFKFNLQFWRALQMRTSWGGINLP